MSTDRELLELAARAAGIEVVRSRLDDPAHRDFLIHGGARNVGQKIGPWNPLTDDGDALRLVVKLGITDLALVVGRLIFDEGEPADIYAATRRAIVRAAAEIGRAGGGG